MVWREVRNLSILVLFFLTAVLLEPIQTHLGALSPRESVQAHHFPIPATVEQPNTLIGRWHGDSQLVKLLNLNFSTDLEISPNPSNNTLTLHYQIGDHKTHQVTPILPPSLPWVQVQRNELNWRDAHLTFRLIPDADGKSAKMYVTKNGVRHLVYLDRVQNQAYAVPWLVRLQRLSVELIKLLDGSFAIQIAVYFGITCAFYSVVWWALKRFLQDRKIQPSYPKWIQVRHDLIHSIIAIATLSLLALRVEATVESGYSRVYTDIAQYGWAYFGLSILLLFILADTFYYWVHRWSHHPKVYKMLHMVHHKSTKPTPWTTLSINVNELVITAIFIVLVLMILPLHRYALLVFSAISLVKNIWLHTGYELLPRWMYPWLRGWLVTPTFHEVHHMRFLSNYGIYFTWWDRWMGTVHPDTDRMLDRFLLPSAGASDVPQTTSSAT